MVIKFKTTPQYNNYGVVYNIKTSLLLDQFRSGYYGHVPVPEVAVALELAIGPVLQEEQ